jgi:CRP-like cAMP-binding protein
LPQGCTVHGAGDCEAFVYFLTAGIVSRFYVTEDGASAEFALTGREGVIGVASFLGGESTPSQALVLSAGNAYRLGSNLLKHEFERDGPLPRLLLGYTRSLLVQTGQIAMCNRFHSLEHRLSRWILSWLDRLPSNELTVTQELIAEMLGVRRVGVTEAVASLQEAGVIRCSRGHIAVLDRPRLEARACECHAVLKRECHRMVPPHRLADVASQRPFVAGVRSPFGTTA